MRLKDTATGYGWLSISLRGYMAAAIILLPCVGHALAMRVGAERAGVLPARPSGRERYGRAVRAWRAR